jgi:peptidoglycan/xylan/chitin deacetylase (PgdA/CDA1 family)
VFVLSLALAVSFNIMLRQVSSQGPVKPVTDNTSLQHTDNTSTATTTKPTATPLLTAVMDNFKLDYDVTPAKQSSGSVRIPVITYHHLAPLPSNPKDRDYYVSPTMFDQQMAYLTAKNYKTITPQEFYAQLKKGVNPTQKTIMITFDDGNEDNYQNAFPILKKYGFTAVFYVPSNKRGMTNSQLKEMANAGMTIDPHGKTHMLLSKITDQAILNDEIVNSKANLDGVTGQTATSFCYPGCEFNSTVIHTIAGDGYNLAFSCGTTIDHKLSQRYSLSRMHVYNDMENFKQILSGFHVYPTSYSD